MSYQEKRGLTNIISSFLITAIYGYIMYQKYLNGALDDSNIFRFWAIIVLIFIPISIIARIIIMIIFHIIEAIVQTAKGNDVDEDLSTLDERDKLFQMKATSVSMYIFSLGFVVALITQLFDVSNHLFFIVLVIAGFLTDFVSEFIMMRYYKKGF